MLEFRIHRDRHFVEITGIPSEDPQEFRSLCEAIAAHPDYVPRLGFYRDRRGMAPLTTPQLRANMDTLAATSGLEPGRWAYVVTDPANYGMARMAAILGDGAAIVELQIFDDPEAAMAWLSERKEPVGA